MIVKASEMDRPTFHSLRYLTRVRPHRIVKHPWLKDPWTEELLTELLGSDPVEEFGVYTRSFYTLEGHYANLWKYDHPVKPRPDDPLLQQAIDITRQAFRLDTPVRSISWDNLKDVPYIASSGAGYGYIGKKGDPGNIDIAISRAVYSLYHWEETILNQTNTPYRFTPDLAWSRTQLGTFEKPKIRHVWGAAFENVLIEGLSAAPLIEAYTRGDYPIVVGTNMYKRIPTVINKALSDEGTPQTGVGLDFSAFDASLQPWMMQAAFDILEENIIFDTHNELLAFEHARYHFIRRPVVMPDGRMWLKEVGLPSGSYYTQLVGSICNHFLITYAQLRVYGHHFTTWVLGDDSIFGIPLELGYPKIKEIADCLAELGMTIHPDKSVIATSPIHLEFLGHCAKGTRVSRETADMMRLALYPEYEVSSPTESYSRIKGLMIDSGLTNWPIVNLYHYATIKFKELQLPQSVSYGADDANWLKAVVHTTITPERTNLITSWLIT